MIVNLLPDLMQQREISIRELSRLTGITYTTIRAVYHGERSSVKLDVLDAICAALNVQPGEIYRCVSPGDPQPRVSQPLKKTKSLVAWKRTRKTSKAPPGGSESWITWE